MEFLLTNVRRAEHPALLKAMRKVRTREDPAIETHPYGAFTLFVGGDTVADSERLYTFGGTAFVDDTFISCFRNHTPRSLAHLRKTALDDIDAVAGCFVLVTVDRETRRFEVITDTLSTYQCFRAEHGGTFAISNNLYYVQAAMAAGGTRLSRSILPFLADYAAGSAYEAGSVFEGVDIVGPGEMLRGRQRVIVRQARRRPNRMKGASYRDLTQLAADRLRRRIGALAQSFSADNVFFDITGGMDSRVVMAAILAQDKPAGWSYRTLFDAPHPDGICADYFAETYGLSRVTGVPADHRRMMTALERMRFEIFAAMGAGAKLGTTITPPHPDVVHLHGGYGEIAGASPDGKRFRPANGVYNYATLARNYLTRLDQLKILGLFSRAGRDWLSGLLSASVEKYRTAGVAPGDVPLRYYNDGRLRSHFGAISKLRAHNRNYPDVLCDRLLETCALRLDPENRIRGKVNFDLIDTLAGDALLGAPLANTPWDAKLFDDPERMRALRKPPVTATTPPLVPGGRVKRPIEPAQGNWDESFVPRPDNNIVLSDMAQVPIAHRDTVRRQRYLAAYLAPVLEDTVLGSLLDRERVAALISAPPETLSLHADRTALQMLCECAVWHHEAELSIFHATA